MDAARIDTTPGIGSAPVRLSDAIARPRDRDGEFGRGQGVPSLGK
jgi:hypothetical protein